MAGDWLKIEVSLPDKPEVWEMAGILSIDPDAVVGKLLKVWRWFDAHTESGNASGVTFALVDSKAGVNGFAEAMNFVGWLIQDGRELRLPNFDRHNGKTAKNRVLTAKRVAAYKSKTNDEGNDSSVSCALPREEKRREEVKEERQPASPTARQLLHDVSDSVANDFIKVRKAKRAPLTETAVDGMRKQAGASGLTLQSALEMALQRGWQSFRAEWVTGQKLNGSSEPVRRRNEL